MWGQVRCLMGWGVGVPGGQMGSWHVVIRLTTVSVTFPVVNPATPSLPPRNPATMAGVPRQSALTEGTVLVASKTDVFSIAPDVEATSFLSAALNVITPARLIPSKTNSIFFSVSTSKEQAAHRRMMPVVAKFGAINDMVVAAVKQTPIGTYLWGVPMSELLAWRPPTPATATIDESELFLPVKVPHVDLKEIGELENTTTHPHLKAQFDKFLSHCPTFRASKIRCAADIYQTESWGFEKTIKVALLAGEDLERKEAAKKAKAAKDRRVSHGAGADAKAKWAELKKELLMMSDENFVLPFHQRYIELEVDPETWRPTMASMAMLEERLACASLAFEPSHASSCLPTSLSHAPHNCRAPHNCHAMAGTTL